MKVFLTWSDESSRHLALALKKWIPSVLQAAEPFISTEIVAGSAWLTEITRNLARSHMGIICLTPENIHKPWVNFEAGALARELEGKANLVVPYLYRISEDEFRGHPLSHFQAVHANRDGTRRLVKALNGVLLKLKAPALTDGRLKKTFNKWWKELAVKLEKTPEPQPPESVRSSDLKFFYYGDDRGVEGRNIFQDFEPGHPVQYMWADANVGSKIDVLAVPGHLKVTFHNAENAYPCNFAIRGREHRPVKNEHGKNFLAFAARLPEKASPASIAVRLVNGYMQHWIHGEGADAYFCESFESPDWKVVTVRIRPDKDKSDQFKKKWTQFKVDGNPLQTKCPDFEYICSVVLEVGARAENRPGAGGGELEIGPVALVDNEDEYRSSFPHLQDWDSGDEGSEADS